MSRWTSGDCHDRMNRQWPQVSYIYLNRINLLQVLCGIDSSGRYPKLHPILASFLQAETWEGKKALHPGVSTISIFLCFPFLYGARYLFKLKCVVIFVI